MNSRAALLVAIGMFLVACDRTPPSYTRGHDPWVVRLNLDRHTRMLSAALHPKLWVAYDTQRAALTGVWPQGVHFHGAVYDQQHGPQPITADPPYLISTLEEPWHIVREGNDARPVVKYRGHRFENGQVYLMYTLALDDGTRVDIEERPEAIPVDEGRFALERTFVVGDLPRGYQVALDFEADRLSSEDNVKIAQRENGIRGQLLLPSGQTTRFVMQFDPPQPTPSIATTPEEVGAEKLMAQSDCAACHNPTLRTVGPSYLEIAQRYKSNEQTITGLSRKIIEGGSGEWGASYMVPHQSMKPQDARQIAAFILDRFDEGDAQGSVLTHPLATLKDESQYEPKNEAPAKGPDGHRRAAPGAPGDRQRLAGVHPSFSLTTIRPDTFKPMVGGLAFLPDGRLLVSTWDPRGSVYLLDNLTAKDRELIKVREIASGLQEPLGLEVVDGVPYVLQKQELTQLVDTDGDDVIDEYRTVANSWRVTDNFHEFAFGLEYLDGHFYATLATAILPGGASAQPQAPDRGKVLRIEKDSGRVEFPAAGLRTPNGIGFGVDRQLFIADNQGDWLPASKLVLVEPGAFYGSRSVDPEGTKNTVETPPVVWLPQDDVSNSPTQPALLDVGPYRNQMVYGDVYYGGLNRVMTQKVEGRLQGCVVPFSQGFEAGINRTILGPDGALYVGGVGNPGNWGQEGKQWYGLQRLAYNEQPTFEMLRVELRSDGIEIELTEPMRAGDGDEPGEYAVSQWRYVPTAEYGGPRVDERDLRVRSVHVSPDRRRVFLEIEDMKPGHVVYVRAEQPMIADSNREMWSTEVWCTVNAIPRELPGPRFEATPSVSETTLSAAEKAAGWRPLFDGKSLAGWRRYQGGKPGAGWRATNGELRLASGGNGGDIVTEEEFGDFELELEWNVAPAGNSGILYRVDERAREIWNFAPEMQILDDAKHPDAQIPSHRAGAVYDLFVATAGVARPPGVFNRARILVRGSRVEHWLNGHKVAQYDTTSEEWKRVYAASKFAKFPQFAQAARGRIGLQDHGDAVRFRNIKIRAL